MRWPAREHGFAVPTVLLLLLAASAIVGVAVTSAVRAQHGTTRDAETKSALTSAEGGIEQALLHYNRVPTTPATPCIVADGGTVQLAAVGANGWCPVSSGSVNGNAFSYQVRPYQVGPADQNIEIVSTGNDDGVIRRVDVNAVAATGYQPFATNKVLAKDGITLDSNTEIYAGTHTDGNMHLNSNAKICGGATVGLGRQLTTNSNARVYATHTPPTSCSNQVAPANVPQAPLVLPPVNQGDAPTNNSNGRFFSQDLISGSKSKVCWNGKKGNGQNGSCGARHLSLDSNTSVTLSGGVYSFCKLEMDSNTNLFIAAGAQVTIYFDTPEACSQPSGTAQMLLNSNSRITAIDGQTTSVALMFMGSDSRATSINLLSNTQVADSCEQNFVIYAPKTTIEMNSNSIYCGAMAGKHIHGDSNARIFAGSGTSNFTIPGGPPHYVVDRFVECRSGAATTVPNEGC